MKLIMLLFLFAASAIGQTKYTTIHFQTNADSFSVSYKRIPDIELHNIVVKGDTITSWIEIHRLPTTKREFEKVLKMLEPKFADPFDGLSFWSNIQMHQTDYPPEHGNVYASTFKDLVKWANKWLREYRNNVNLTPIQNE